MASQTAKKRSYTQGFNTEAKAQGLNHPAPTCPYSVLDDPTLSSQDAYDLGRADARDAAKGIRA